MNLLVIDITCDTHPECSVTHFKESYYKFFSVQFNPGKAISEHPRVNFFLDSERDLINFKNSVVAACDQILYNLAEQRRHNV